MYIIIKYIIFLSTNQYIINYVTKAYAVKSGVKTPSSRSIGTISLNGLFEKHFPHERHKSDGKINDKKKKFQVIICGDLCVNRTLSRIVKEKKIISFHIIKGIDFIMDCFPFFFLDIK